MTPEQQVEYINRQDRMNRIKKVAEMYANATPEQRAKVDASTVKSLINEYRELQEMQRQAEDMEQRAQLEAMRAQEEAQRAAAQWVGWGRRVVRTTPTNTPTPTPTPETVTTGPQWYTYEEWGTIWYVDPNGNEIAVAWRYPGYGKTPYEEQVVINNWVLPAYDPRYDVNSDQYVYNKTTTWLSWTQPLPEYADSYHMYDNAGNLRWKQYKDYLENRIMWNPTVWDVAVAVWTMVPAYSAVNTSAKASNWSAMTQAFRNTATRDYANGFTRNVWSNYTPSYTVKTTPTVTMPKNNYPYTSTTWPRVVNNPVGSNSEWWRQLLNTYERATTWPTAGVARQAQLNSVWWQNATNLINWVRSTTTTPWSVTPYSTPTTVPWTTSINALNALNRNIVAPKII